MKLTASKELLIDALVGAGTGDYGLTKRFKDWGVVIQTSGGQGTERFQYVRATLEGLSPDTLASMYRDVKGWVEADPIAEMVEAPAMVQ